MAYQYHRMSIAKGKTRDEHRLIMEAALGRKLATDEVVHHINGNPKDNRIENLQVMSRSEHTKYHFPNGQIPSEAGIKRIKERLTGKPRYDLARCNSEQIENVLLLRSQGLTESQISNATGIARGTVHDVITGRSLCYKEYLSRRLAHD